VRRGRPHARGPFPDASAVTAGELRGALPPAARARGLRLVLLDGTWAEARTLARALPRDVRFVTLTERGGARASLFSPCRVQPHASRVCTAEAYAAALDDWRAAAAGGSGGGHPEGGGTTRRSSPLPEGHHPAVPRDALADAVRLCTRAHVDAYVRQAGLLGGPHSRGVGYRTWSLGVESGGAFFGALPATVVIAVAAFAYGEGAFAPASGYVARWRAHGSSSGRGGDGNGEGEGGNGAADGAPSANDTGGASDAAPQSPPRLVQGTLAKPQSHGGLPRLAHPQQPIRALALCCKALLFLAAGLVRERSHARSERINGVRQRGRAAGGDAAAGGVGGAAPAPADFELAAAGGVTLCA